MADAADPQPPYDGAPGDPLAEQRLSGVQVYAGKLLDVRSDRVLLPDGGDAVREYVVHGGAVLMLPVLDDGRCVVVRQFRYPMNRAFIEFPAGKLDAGEAPLATAERELIEEAGYRAAHWTGLGVIHPVISYSTEAIEIYVARGLTHVGAKLDPGEFLEVLTMSTAELDAAQDAGRLTDAKTIAALSMHARWLAAASRTIDVRVTGRVQGVGYRDWACRVARTAGVSGWGRNRRDQSVEIFAAGDREACDRLVRACSDGPDTARVERVVVTPVNGVRAPSGFEQRETR
jgi:ADP-ribose pyrophosphatase